MIIPNELKKEMAQVQHSGDPGSTKMQTLLVVRDEEGYW